MLSREKHLPPVKKPLNQDLRGDFMRTKIAPQVSRASPESVMSTLSPRHASLSSCCCLGLLGNYAGDAVISQPGAIWLLKLWQTSLPME